MPVSASANRTTLGVHRQSGSDIVTLANLEQHPANVYFVDSNATLKDDVATAGRSADFPFATIDFAIGQCTAGQGDVIYVMPGHTETVSGAAGIDFDVADVKVIGLGWGANRPTITLSAVASTVHVDAASIWIENLIFTVSADATIVIDVDKADCTIKDCEFRNSATKEAVTFIDITGAANGCDRARVLGCVFRAPGAGTTQAIELGEVADGVVIRDCWAFGAFGAAAIHNPTGKILTLLTIMDCVLVNTTAASHSIELVSACTGIIAFNRLGSPLADATPTDLDGGACHMLENFSHDAGGNDQGLRNPVVDT